MYCTQKEINSTNYADFFHNWAIKSRRGYAGFNWHMSTFDT